MTNEEFISQHLHDNVRNLALRRTPEGVDPVWCLQQIEGWQLASVKLPSWAAIEGMYFPPRLSLEQCSSEQTAIYKRHIVERLLPDNADREKMADFTGGFGVDFSFLAPIFRHSLYVEKLQHLCTIAQHNFSLLGLTGAEVIFADSIEENRLREQDFSFVFIDPARRDNVGRKTVAISDCTPDVTALLPQLLAHSKAVMIKLSPMLDIKQALRELPHVSEVHVVSVKGECKELLLVCEPESTKLTCYCTNLGTEDDMFITDGHDDSAPQSTNASIATEITCGHYLYEPNASVLKAGVQDILCQKYGVCKLHPMSNLFVSPDCVENFPGRCFKIINFSDFGKRNLKNMLSELKQANLAIRNFPSTVAELRKRLKLKEGGDAYLFATTLSDNSHALILCNKVTRA